MAHHLVRIHATPLPGIVGTSQSKPSHEFRPARITSERIHATSHGDRDSKREKGAWHFCGKVPGTFLEKASYFRPSRGS